MGKLHCITQFGVVISTRLNSYKRPRLIQDIQDHQGQTPLHDAVSMGFSINLITLLLQAHADPNITDHQNKTPLFYATSPEIIELLRQYGAKYVRRRR